jgi:hypothetical protein
MNGLCIGLTEILLFFIISFYVKKYSNMLQNIKSISYYWLLLTILTGIWETAFLINYPDVNQLSEQLIKNHTHVWTNNYDISYLLPWKLSKIFYSEYGAYADREYMTLSDDWSRVIEGTHAIFCGLFALLAINLKTRGKLRQFNVAVGVSMGSQLMNSILYMMNYFNQLNDPDNINHISKDFPAGKALLKRPFMYVNIFWTVMPTYVIISSMQINNLNLKIV